MPRFLQRPLRQVIAHELGPGLQSGAPRMSERAVWGGAPRKRGSVERVQLHASARVVRDLQRAGQAGG